jgi:hypothetical protein
MCAPNRTLRFATLSNSFNDTAGPGPYCVDGSRSVRWATRKANAEISVYTWYRTMDELEPRLDILLLAGVMGCFPDYLEFARDYSVNALAVPERLWRVMVNTAENWTMVSSFWRQVGRSKRSIILASNPALISTGSLYAMELEFLRKLGYLAVPSGTRLDFGGEPIVRALGQAPSKSTLGPIQQFLQKFFPQSTFRAKMQRKLTPKGSDSDFEEKVRQGLPFLFRDFSASVVSNQCFPAAFGNAVVVLAVATLLIRVVRDRDEIRIDVAPAHAPKEWRQLTLALAAVDSSEQNPVMSSCISLRQGAALFRDGFESLRAAFMPERYEFTKRVMQDIETTKLQEWVLKFNSPTLANEH